MYPVDKVGNITAQGLERIDDEAQQRLRGCCELTSEAYATETLLRKWANKMAMLWRPHTPSGITPDLPPVGL